MFRIDDRDVSSHPDVFFDKDRFRGRHSTADSDSHSVSDIENWRFFLPRDPLHSQPSPTEDNHERPHRDVFRPVQPNRPVQDRILPERIELALPQWAEKAVPNRNASHRFLTPHGGLGLETLDESPHGQDGARHQRSIAMATRNPLVRMRGNHSRRAMETVTAHTNDRRVFDQWTVGDQASITRVIEAEDVTRFVELTGDDNPIHVNEDYGNKAGIGGRVVHGMLTASYVSTVIGTILPGPGALWLSQSFNFRAPVRIGDQILIEVRVRHVSPGTRVLVLDVKVRNLKDKVVLDGEAHVHVIETEDTTLDTERTAGTVVVTGSGRGIGAAIARRLAADGLRVVLNYVRDDASANETLRSIVEAGGEATLVRADVSDPPRAEELMSRALETFGSVDALVNNAGSPTDPRALQDTTWADMEKHLATHLRGSFLCVRAILPAMIERGFGRIVNMTSQAAYGTPPNKMTGYVVAKAALAAFTKCIAVEGGPHGITANAIAPGMVETDLVADVSPRIKMTEAARTPLRRLAKVEDVADLVSFLLGRGGSFVTGQTIHLSGGQVSW